MHRDCVWGDFTRLTARSRCGGVAGSLLGHANHIVVLKCSATGKALQAALEVFTSSAAGAALEVFTGNMPASARDSVPMPNDHLSHPLQANFNRQTHIEPPPPQPNSFAFRDGANHYEG